MLSRRALSLPVVAALVAASGARAQDGAATRTDAPGAAVAEVVVTASPYAISAQSLTSHVDVLSRAELATAPPAGLGDLLNGLPGVRSSSYSPGASRPVIRGLSGPRVLVLQNGVGQIDVSDVSPDHAVASDPAEASRIEVLRGPSTLLYGGSGIGGVVNILDDRVPSRKPRNGVEGRFNVSGSSVDGGYSVNGGTQVGIGNWVVSADADRRESGDYAIPVPAVSERLQQAAGVTADPERTLRNTFSDLSTLGAGLSYIGEWGFLGASARRLDSRYGVPYAQFLGQPPGGEEGPVYLDLGQTRVDVKGEIKLPGVFEKARLAGGWADYDHSEIARNTGAINTTFLSEGGEGRIELVQRARGAWRGAVGINGLHRSFDATGDEAFVPPSRISRVGVFTLQRYDTAKWGFEGGLRVDRVAIDASVDRRFPLLADALGGAASVSRDFTDVSGSVAAFARPLEGLFLSLNYAHNARAPTEVELFADGPHAGTGAFEVGDPGLGSESVDSVEATVRYTRDRFHAEAHPYYARYGDYIEESATGRVDPEGGLPVFQFRQLAATFYGVELEGSYAVWRRDGQELRLEAAYDAVRGQGETAPLARIPPSAVTGRIAYTAPRLEGRLELRHVAEQDRVAGLESPADSYTTVALFASVKPFSDRNVRLFVDARNLTDAEVREHASFLKDIAPAPGRNLRLGLSYSF